MHSNARRLQGCSRLSRRARIVAAAVVAVSGFASLRWQWLTRTAVAEVRKPRSARATVERDKEGSFATFERHALETQTVPRRTPPQSKGGKK